MFYCELSVRFFDFFSIGSLFNLEFCMVVRDLIFGLEIYKVVIRTFAVMLVLKGPNESQ